MVQFKVFVSTPRGGHYSTYYARSEKKAEFMVNQWNSEFKDTGYHVTLVHISNAVEEELPEHYICW